MSNIIQEFRLMLIENLASAASRKGGLDETEAAGWAQSQSDRILASTAYDYDSLEQLMLDDVAAEMFWRHELIA